MGEELKATVTLELQEGYRFRADFGLRGGVPPLVMDEPEPLGEASGPNAVRVLTAVGNCLSASALYCLRKSRVEVRGYGPPRRRRSVGTRRDACG